MVAARERYGADAATDGYRGLYVSAEQAERALAGAAGEPLMTGAPYEGAEEHGPSWDEIVAVEPGWAWLRDTYRLSELELDVVLIALAPEVDLRYEQLYGYLQDDVTRRRPTVSLALDLLTAAADARLSARRAFGPGAALLTRRVVALVPDSRAVAPPLLAHLIVPDGQIVDILLEQGGLDRRLGSYCRLVTPRESAIGEVPATSRALLATVAAAWGRHPLRLYFRGSTGAGRRRTAEAAAANVGARLLTVGLADDGVADLFPVIFREALLQGAVLYLDDLDALPADRRPALAEALAGHTGVVILAGGKDWRPLDGPPLGVLEVPFTRTDLAFRRDCWQRALAACGVTAEPDDLDTLAGRFRFGPAQIEDAVLTAVAAAGVQATRADLFAAARRQTGHELTALARKIEPVYGWDDIVLPADSLAQLRELCERVAHRQRVMDDWGFDRRLSQGKGISALFAGPPGTGKTMAAEVVARALGLDLYKIDLSMVISKYIGETEKNLERVFTAASDADAILFFDEADALFGKRSEVRDSHDRYANVEISYLLQRMEQYDGIAILATNLRQHLDDAFTRRLQFVVEFPFPDEDERGRIWRVCFPAEAPCDSTIDLERLAREFRLSGGNIRNIVLAAAYLAATDDVPIGMPHVLRATRREYQKAGKVLSESDFVLAPPGEG